MATECAGSGVFWEGLWCRLRSAADRALSGATCYELPSDLKMMTTCAGLGVPGSS